MHVFRAVSMLRFSMFPAVHTLVLVRFRRLSVVYGACCFRTGHFPVGLFYFDKRSIRVDKRLGALAGEVCLSLLPQ